jgi:hypothetical protein
LAGPDAVRERRYSGLTEHRTEEKGLMSERTGGKICRRCGGRSQSEQPLGWYALSAGVPPEIDPNGFKWVGLFCTADCLGAYMPEIQRMADLAEQVFEREPAAPRQTPRERTGRR